MIEVGTTRETARDMTQDEMIQAIRERTDVPVFFGTRDGETWGIATHQLLAGYSEQEMEDSPMTAEQLLERANIRFFVSLTTPKWATPQQVLVRFYEGEHPRDIVQVHLTIGGTPQQPNVSCSTSFENAETYYKSLGATRSFSHRVFWRFPWFEAAQRAVRMARLSNGDLDRVIAYFRT